MINLLPDERKQEIRAGRMNVLLLRYNIFVLAAIGIIGVACLAFYVVLRNSQLNAQAATDSNSSQEASLTKVKSDADNYSKNLTTARQILDNGISYTDVIVAITKLIPSGVVFDSLNLQASSFGQQTAFAAHASSYAAALQLKQNLQSSKVFTNVFFTTLTDENAAKAGAAPSPYPITITISAKLNKAGTF